jgi:hypothetical protein
MVQAACRSDVRSSKLPASLSDEEFWSVSTRLSEPAGVFTHSDTLVSNEAMFAHVVRMLRPRGGVYIGVGPEQNFSYIATLRPAVAFIIDIRRENLNLHLMYKAVFELSATRADFISRLFSRERPAGLEANTPVQDLFARYEAVKPAPALYEANLREIREHLLDRHRFPLTTSDLEQIEYAVTAFYSDGPAIHYGRVRPKDSPGPSYRSLMEAVDMRGANRSYLADEEGFAFVKDLHARNMIVPVVGDFAGPDAIRRTADYIKQHQGMVDAFYSSNVEVYLNREKTRAFCRNLAHLPHDSRSWFIESKGMLPFASKLKSCSAAAVIFNRDPP